jgi:Leucine-rich repeat (LRR) protein
MQDLRVLSIEDAFVTGPALEHIGGLSKLSELKFFQTYLSADSLTHLSNLKGLKKLGLRLNAGINDESMKALEGLTELTEIELSETSVSGAGMESLAKLPKLERVTLWLTQVDDVGAEHLGKATSLKRLSLQKTLISDGGLAHLKGLENLEWLNIGENELTDAGLEHLAKITSLKELIVTNCPAVTSEAVDKLKAAIPGLRVEQ